MKKLFALLLALAMVLSLAACGGNGNTDTTVTLVFTAFTVDDLNRRYDKFYMGWVLNEGISLFGYEAMEKFYAILEHFSSDSYLERSKQFVDENPIDKIGQ